MKSLTKSIKSKFVAEDVQVQLSFPVAGMLRDVQSAFFGLCVESGKAVLAAMMESERTALCGPKGVPSAQRAAYRGGHTRSSVTLGGRRIAISHPRARSLEAAELSLPSFAWATHCDPLNAATIAAIPAGVPTRRYQGRLDPLPASGSPSRRIGPFYQDDPGRDRSLFFWMYNRGKRSVTLDLLDPGDKRRYLELASSAHVILDAQGIGVMDGLALGYDHVSRLNAGLVYCSITPFGLTGPWRNFKGSDLIHQALGGSAYCIGYDQISPEIWDTPPFMAQSWHSYAIAGEHASVAVAAALLHRQSSGTGQLSLNPHAVFYGKPITKADYLNARMIADPLSILDCDMPVDGCGAVIVTTAERARDLRQPPCLHRWWGHGRLQIPAFADP